MSSLLFKSTCNEYCLQCTNTKATGMQCLKDLSCDAFAAAGLQGPPDAALHRPEGPTILSYPHQVHELWTSGCNGKDLHATDCVRHSFLCDQKSWIERTAGGSAKGQLVIPVVVSCRCGKARVWWKRAEWCWVRPTLLSPSPEPSGEISASTSASECLDAYVGLWGSNVWGLFVFLDWVDFFLICCPCLPRNIIHGSDSVESANKEVSLWFKEDELASYESCALSWLY